MRKFSDLLRLPDEMKKSRENSRWYIAEVRHCLTAVKQ